MIRGRGLTAFLTVQEGCDKFCSFCVVPYTRGAETSRPLEQVLAEARNLVDAGVRELTLLGQNVNAYHGLDATGRSVGLGELCARLGEIEGLARIRYTTSHPADMTDELIAAHRDNPKLMPYLHLPVQSGSDRDPQGDEPPPHPRRLPGAHRSHQGRRGPIMALSGDFIVGFPGETDDDFEADAVDRPRGRLRLGLHLQIFDPPRHPRRRPWPIRCPKTSKTERLARLNALITAQMRDFGQSVVGRTLDVLLEKPGRMPGQIGGRSPYLQAVHIEAPGASDRLRPAGARSSRAGNNSIEGKIVTHTERKTASVVESQALAAV